MNRILINDRLNCFSLYICVIIIQLFGLIKKVFAQLRAIEKSFVTLSDTLSAYFVVKVKTLNHKARPADASRTGITKYITKEHKGEE